jgi:hypothetical protein
MLGIVHNKRVQDQVVLDSYCKTKSIWKTGKEVGLCGQSVYERLVRLKAIKSRRFTTEEIQKIKDFYGEPGNNDPKDLISFSKELGRKKTNICAKANQLGLTCMRRKESIENRAKISARHKKWHQENEHPRGMLGKHHSPEYCKEISKRVIRWHKEVSPERKRAKYVKTIKTKVEKYGSAGNKLEDVKVSWKQSWREIGGKRIYCRSRWEANYARYLEYLKLSGSIKEWEHEPKTFWFEGLKRGCVSYLPDFRITQNDGSHEWHEVKGWYDKRSKTKIRRFRKYYSKEKLVVIDIKWYRVNQKILVDIIKDWEYSKV